MRAMGKKDFQESKEKVLRLRCWSYRIDAPGSRNAREGRMSDITQSRRWSTARPARTLLFQIWPRWPLLQSAVDEWIGASPDVAILTYVKQRIPRSLWLEMLFDQDRSAPAVRAD